MNKKTISGILACVLVLTMLASAFTPAPSAASESKTEAINEAQASFSDLYEAVNPSVVYIAVAIQDSSKGSSGGNNGGQSPFNFDFGDLFGPELEEYFKDYQNNNDDNQDMKEQNGQEEKEAPLSYASGTGFVWDNDGHIVTNNHVIENAVEITVTFYDGTERDAVLVGTDPDSDLAVIHVDDVPEGIGPVTMGDSTQLKPGDLTAAIGNPLGNTGTMTQGIISALGRSYAVDNGTTDGNYTIPDVIQTDASINPGNSGGVLINLDGEVIGVVMAFSSMSYSSAGIGYAIPAALVSRVVPSLISDGSYAHPWIGFSGIALTPTVNEALGLDHDQRGAYVQTVTKNSPAEKGGLVGGSEDLDLGEGVTIKKGGDIITKIDDEDVKGMDDVIAYLSSHTSIGDTLTLHVIRADGKEEDVSVVLEARPTSSEREQASTQDEDKQAEGGAYLGVYIQNLTPEVLTAMKLTEDTTGVLVTDVTEDGPAEGLLNPSKESTKVDGKEVSYGGDIITKIGDVEITNTQELKAEISKHLPGERISLTIIRDGEAQEIRLTLGNTLSR